MSDANKKKTRACTIRTILVFTALYDIILYCNHSLSQIQFVVSRRVHVQLSLEFILWLRCPIPDGFDCPDDHESEPIELAHQSGCHGHVAEPRDVVKDRVHSSGRFKKDKG